MQPENQYAMSTIMNIGSFIRFEYAMNARRRPYVIPNAPVTAIQPPTPQTMTFERYIMTVATGKAVLLKNVTDLLSRARRFDCLSKRSVSSFSRENALTTRNPVRASESAEFSARELLYVRACSEFIRLNRALIVSAKSGTTTSAQSARGTFIMNMMTRAATICTTFLIKYGAPSMKNQYISLLSLFI